MPYSPTGNEEKMRKFISVLAAVLLCATGVSPAFAATSDNTKNAAADHDFVIVNRVLTEYTGNKENIVIPDDLGINAIGKGAFENRSGITSITLPDSVTIIGDEAFMNCTADIAIPDGVISIGDSAFCCCGITSLTIPDSVTEIGANAFSCCGGLKSVKLPVGIKAISDGMLSNCAALKSVALPKGLLSIGSCAFFGLHRYQIDNDP